MRGWEETAAWKWNWVPARRSTGGRGQAVWIPTKRLDRGLACGLSAVVGGREQRSVVSSRHVVEEGRQSELAWPDGAGQPHGPMAAESEGERSQERSPSTARRRGGPHAPSGSPSLRRRERESAFLLAGRPEKWEGGRERGGEAEEAWVKKQE